MLAKFLNVISEFQEQDNSFKYSVAVLHSFSRSSFKVDLPLYVVGL
jgi:hypothetical protein